jgi:hypothetical protein
MNSRLLDENFYFHFLISELATQNTHPGRFSPSKSGWTAEKKVEAISPREFALNSRYQRPAIGPSFYCDSASQHIYGCGRFFSHFSARDTEIFFTRMSASYRLAIFAEIREKRAERNRFNRENNKLFIV